MYVKKFISSFCGACSVWKRSTRPSPKILPTLKLKSNGISADIYHVQQYGQRIFIFFAKPRNEYVASLK